MFRVGPWMGGWAWGWPMLVSSLVFWALVVAAIVLVIRYLARGGQHWAGPRPFHPGPGGFPPPGVPGPEQILAERFARGEIDEQEFRQRMAALRTEAQHWAPPPGAPPPPGQPPPPAQAPPPG